MSGKLKDQRKLSARDWSPAAEFQLQRLIDAGEGYDAIAAQLGRTRLAVTIKARRLKAHLRATQTTLSARAVADLLGVDRKTVVAWITRFAWLAGTRQHPGECWRIRWEALYRFMEQESAWMAWSPERVTDHALRAWAVELRAGKPGWLSVGAIARRFYVTPQTVHVWLTRGEIPHHEVAVYGRRWIRETAFERFVPPSLRMSTGQTDHDA